MGYLLIATCNNVSLEIPTHKPYLSQVAASLVLCTFLSAPIMYVAARMVLIPYATTEQYHAIISDVQRDVAIPSALGVVREYCSFLNHYIKIEPEVRESVPLNFSMWPFPPLLVW